MRFSIRKCGWEIERTHNNQPLNLPFLLLWLKIIVAAVANCCGARDGAICDGQSEFRYCKTQKCNISMSLLTCWPPEGSKRWPSHRARGWGSPWGDRSAVEGGGRRLWLVKWGSTWPKHKTSQHFQNTRKINATTYRIDVASHE